MRILLAMFLLLLSSPAFAGISFNSGKWSTTFNCAEWTQNNPLSCDGLELDGGWMAATHADQITSDANNPKGEGGRGFRHWRGDGTNVSGGGIKISFPSPQKELWIRWYERYQAGFKWSSLSYSKTLYIHTNAPNIDAIPEFWWDSYAIVAQSTPDYYQVLSDYGWPQIMGGSTSDGQFHLYEIHLKMDTNNSDGVGQLWIDGVLRTSNTAVNWSNGNATARNGWANIEVGSNQSSPNNGGDMYNDFDDFVIYNTTPPNRDAQGNPFIGPVSGSVAPSLSAPTGLKIIN